MIDIYRRCKVFFMIKVVIGYCKLKVKDVNKVVMVNVDKEIEDLFMN